MATFSEWRGDSDPEGALDWLLSQDATGAGRALEDYEAWLVKIRAQASSTVDRRLASLRAACREARREKLIDWTPAPRRLKNLTAEERRAGGKRDMSGPTDAEMTDLMAHLRSLAASDPAAARELAMIQLLSNPMLRRSELVALDLSDLDLTPGAEVVRILGKGRRETEKLPLAETAVDNLRPWLEHRKQGAKGPLFVRLREEGRITAERLSPGSIRYLTVRLGETLLLRKRALNPHGFRHYGITKTAEVIVREARPITEGMALSRHRKIETFYGYVDRAQGAARHLANAVAAVGAQKKQRIPTQKRP